MIAPYAIEIDACGIREQHQNEREFGNEVDRGVTHVDIGQVEPAGPHSEAENNEDHWCSDYRALKSA